MVRGLIPGLESPRPLGALLPGVYAEDSFAQRFVAALDEVLAPILVTLDCFDAYLDPWLAPADFLEWLAGWVGLELDETLPVERRRRLVGEAARLFAIRGTAGGLGQLIEAVTGLEVQIEESGGCTWSSRPGASPPGSPSPFLAVRVVRKDGERVDLARLDELVRANKPAHVPHRVEVVEP